MRAFAPLRRSNVQLTLMFFLLLSMPLGARAQCTFTNGTFETGDLSGWTVYNRSQNIGNWFNYTGTATPLTVHNISAPPQGTRAATTDHNAPTTHEMYQNFTIPAGQSGTLSFFLAYNNTNGFFTTLNTLDWVNNQQARVDLIKTTAANESIAPSDVYFKLFQTQPGDPLILSPTQMFFDVSSLAGTTVRLRFAEAVGLSYFPLAVDNVCFSTTRTTFTQSTPAGSNVKVNFGEVKVTYPSVAVAGNTSVQQLDPAAQTGAPVGDTFIGPAWDISTTATVTTPIRVCYYLPSITDNNTFLHLRMLHKVGGVWIDVPSSTKNVAARLLCGDVLSLSPFAVAVNPSAPTAAAAQISGRVTTSEGAPLGGVVMRATGSESQRTITDESGFYSFSVQSGGFVMITADRGNYSFTPSQRSITPIGNVTDATFTAVPDAVPTVNPLDEDLFFVRQQYLDFLGRGPDASGLDYWAGELGKCGADQACRRHRRVDISAAFFTSEESQQTGSFIYRLYSAGLGRRLSYDEFAADRLQVVGGANLSESRAAFAQRFVEREEFQRQYLSSATAESFVDALLASVSNDSGVDLSGQRPNLVSRYSSGASLNESRSLVLRDLIEAADFKQAVYNPSFVLMQYFAYLKRNPDESGYRFWLNVLDDLARREPGNFGGMVCSFLTSAEYQQRFAPVVTHSNGECGP